MNQHYTYLLLDLGSLFFPFILSFDKKVGFYKHWKDLFPSIIITSIFFIIWDVFFTQQNVWSFNPDYITGIYIFNLPIEEVLFFICVPYACVFIFEVLKAYFKTSIIKNALLFSLVVIGISLLSGLIHFDKIYTTVNSFICLFLVVYATFIKKFKDLNWFYFAYLISLIPFLICNGVLTALPIVSYNSNEFSNIRIYTIPFEDVFYCLSLLLSNVLLMYYFRARRMKKASNS
jgi:lycopene cyclase domain-containing protein